MTGLFFSDELMKLPEPLQPASRVMSKANVMLKANPCFMRASPPFFENVFFYATT
jgi:hypothetical protein